MEQRSLLTLMHWTALEAQMIRWHCSQRAGQRMQSFRIGACVGLARLLHIEHLEHFVSFLWDFAGMLMPG